MQKNEGSWFVMERGGWIGVERETEGFEKKNEKWKISVTKKCGVFVSLSHFSSTFIFITHCPHAQTETACCLAIDLPMAGTSDSNNSMQNQYLLCIHHSFPSFDVSPPHLYFCLRGS